MKIPVIANGDITTPEKAKHVLEYTKADAVMIGRAAQGRPWIFREISHYLATGEHLPLPEVAEIHRVLINHLHELYAFYGEYSGVRIARKHISWYTKGLVGSAVFPPRNESVAKHRPAIGGRKRIFQPARRLWPATDLC